MRQRKNVNYIRLLLVASIVGVVNFFVVLSHASADEIFYCYKDVELASNDEFEMRFAPTMNDEYSVALNLTQKRIDYNDQMGDGDDWVDAVEVQRKGNEWIMVSPSILYSDSIPVILKRL